MTEAQIARPPILRAVLSTLVLWFATLSLFNVLGPFAATWWWWSIVVATGTISFLVGGWVAGLRNADGWMRAALLLALVIAAFAMLVVFVPMPGTAS